MRAVVMNLTTTTQHTYHTPYSKYVRLCAFLVVKNKQMSNNEFDCDDKKNEKKRKTNEKSENKKEAKQNSKSTITLTYSK